MEQLSMKILFFQKQSISTQSPISTKVTIDGKSTTFSTGIRATSKEWNQAKQRINSTTKHSVEKNAILSNIESMLYEIYYTLRANRESLSAKIIKEHYQGKSTMKEKYYLLALFAYHNTTVEKQVGVNKSKATYQKYQVTLRHLKEYIRCCYEKEDIQLSKIDYRFICGFELHLRTTGECAHNTTAKFMQFFKRIIIIALNEGYIKENPFRNYQIKLKSVKRVYLSPSELQTMMEKKFATPRLELIRDLYIFACFSGISYIDIKNLKKEHLHATSDGSWWLRFDRKKSGEFSNIKLLDIPKALIEKYADETSESLFNVPSNQKVNSYLKEIADLCGINKPISYHSGRHTMATTVGLSNGLPIESLAKMLGHSNIRTTQHYAKITDIKLGEDIDELSVKLRDIFR